jgi:hypothetical protein
MPQIATPFLLSSRAPVERRPSIFWRLPFRLAPFVTWNMESHSNLKMLGVRDDETRKANPRPRLPGWVRFTPGVSSREKNNRPDRNLNALGYPEPIWWLCWRRRVWAEKRVLKDKRDSRAPGISLLGLSHRNLGDERHSFIFWYTKGLIRNPPNNELIPKVFSLTLISYVNNKLQNRHASVNLLHL